MCRVSEFFDGWLWSGFRVDAEEVSTLFIQDALVGLKHGDPGFIASHALTVRAGLR